MSARWGQLFERDARERDAGKVLQYQRVAQEIDSERSRQDFEAAVRWFEEKHRDNWVNFVTAEERVRG